MSKVVNLGSVMEGIFAIAVGLILCESDLPSRSLIRRVQALIGITGRKARVGGSVSWK